MPFSMTAKYTTTGPVWQSIFSLGREKGDFRAPLKLRFHDSVFLCK
jgi:hypothetical protein